LGDLARSMNAIGNQQQGAIVDLTRFSLGTSMISFVKGKRIDKALRFDGWCIKQDRFVGKTGTTVPVFPKFSLDIQINLALHSGLQKAMPYQSSKPTSISQWASIAALNGEQKVVQNMVTALGSRAFYAFPRVDDIFKFDGWEKITEKYDDQFNSAKLATYLLEKARTAVVPGIGFGNDNYSRMPFATSDENRREGLKRIKEAIEKLV